MSIKGFFKFYAAARYTAQEHQRSSPIVCDLIWLWAPFDDKKFIVELPSNKAEVSSTPLAFSKSTSIEVSCHREVHIPLACEEACELRSILSISCARM